MAFSDAGTIVIVLLVLLAVGAVLHLRDKLGLMSHLDLDPASDSGAGQGRLSEKLNMTYEELLQEGDKLSRDVRYHDALKYYEEALKLNREDALLYYRLGRNYFLLDQFGRSEAALQSAHKFDPESPEIMYELAKVYYKQNKYEFAIKIVDQMIEVAPNHQEALKLKTRSLLELKRNEEASAIIESLLEQDPDNHDLLLLLAWVYVQTETWEKALEIYRRLLPFEANDRKNLKHKIYEIYLYQAEYDEAIDTLENVLATGTGTINTEELKQELSDCWNGKAEVALAAKDTETAIGHYQKALHCHPRNVDSYLGLGKIYAGQGKKSEAMLMYKKALDVGVPNAKSYVEIATLYEMMDQYDDAIECMMKALQQMPTAQVHYYIGTLYGLKGDIYSCTDYLKKAVELKTDYVDAYYNLAVAYEQQRKSREAVELYKKVLSLDPDHVEARTNLKHVRHQMDKSW